MWRVWLYLKLRWTFGRITVHDTAGNTAVLHIGPCFQISPFVHFADEEDAVNDDCLATQYTEVKPKQIVPQPKPRERGTSRAKFRNPFKMDSVELKTGISSRWVSSFACFVSLLLFPLFVEYSRSFFCLRFFFLVLVFLFTRFFPSSCSSSPPFLFVRKIHWHPQS